MIHILNQSEPYPDGWGSKVKGPAYFSESVYEHAAALLGLEVRSHPVGFAKGNTVATVRLSLKALETIRNVDEGLAIIWQGYGVYAVLANLLLRRKSAFILNTYKVPLNGNGALKSRINDRLLVKAIKSATGVIAISSSQARALRSYNTNTLWVPFASDVSWWTPGLPNYAYLSSHGIGYRDYVLVMGDVYRDEATSLKALRDLEQPILRVTRNLQTASAARAAFKEFNIKHGDVLVNVSFELLREIYRGARAVLIPAKSSLYPAGMTSLTEAMSCGRPVMISAGQTTEGYVKDGHDAFVLDELEEFAIRDRMAIVYESEIGETVGRNARNTVEERLNFRASAAKLANFIARLA